MLLVRRALLPLLALTALACSHAAPAPAAGVPTGDREAAIQRVSAVHGGAGPWVVAGYRMGEFALGRLHLDRQSFDLDVVHHSPHAVQFSCIADGAAAATGASMGKLNLRLEDADEAHTLTTYRKKSTGETVTLRPSAKFVERFANVPRADLAKAGREVLDLPDGEIFEEVR